MEEYDYLRFYNSQYSQSVIVQYTDYKFFIDTENILKPSNYMDQHELLSGTYDDHKDLLKTAKKLYIHPSCKLSRTTVATKYKKCLDPWMADAVVLPSSIGVHIYTEDFEVLFINEEKKCIFELNCNGEPELYDLFNEGDCLEKIIKPEHLNDEYFDTGWGVHNLATDTVRKAKMFYKGSISYINKKDEFLLDAIMHTIPNNKIVFESTVMESLGSEETKLDIDNLMSIKEMLESSDENTAGAALKSLAVMDYMHYPNSVKYLLKQVYNKVYYNKARHSTSVKYMLDYLLDGDSIRRLWRLGYSSEIAEDDYKLFRQLVMRIEGCADDAAVNEQLKYMSFMAINNEGILAPKMKAS